ncbi:DUF5808 domain-containing protein [Xylanimonas sp. McL0601]|uniref:DUF5808 domain-containing protein n=1 Tax=Xylanimonas sp. McL0601 TaxID=3414739 RepID=UPI003CEC27F0
MAGKTKRGGIRRLVTLASIVLSGVAVVKELRTPADQRTWNGKVVAVVPYDFRRPTLARAKERMWNPDSSTIVGPRVFGVGWTVNVGRLFALGRQRLAKK